MEYSFYNRHAFVQVPHMVALNSLLSIITTIN